MSQSPFGGMAASLVYIELYKSINVACYFTEKHFPFQTKNIKNKIFCQWKSLDEHVQLIFSERFRLTRINRHIKNELSRLCESVNRVCEMFTRLRHIIAVCRSHTLAVCLIHTCTSNTRAISDFCLCENIALLLACYFYWFLIRKRVNWYLITHIR